MKRLICGILSVVLIISCALMKYNSKVNVPTQAKVYQDKVIIIDAGHGGFDGGAVADDGTVEKNINLSIALKLGKMLSLHGYKVIYTRTEDTGTEDDSSLEIKNRKKSDLNNRLELMKKYPNGIFVSVHLNKFTSGSAVGAQVFYSPAFDEARYISQSIQESIKAILQTANDRVIKKGTKSTYLLHNAHIPSIIVECGFLSNADELQKLKNEDYQNQMAFSIFNGIIKSYV